MFRVRFYFGDRDYDGKIVRVKSISFTNNNDGRVVTESGEIWNNPKDFVILEPVKVSYDVFSKRLEITGE